MNMTLSKRGDYVMRSAILLARVHAGGGLSKLREVVEETKVPRTFASQILADLVHAGIASSKAGRDGGYRLNRAPEAISALEVVEAAEGPLRAERCALGEGPCHWEAVCPLHETWTAATARLRDLLAATTLAELAARDLAIEAGTYAVPVDAHRGNAATTAVADAVHVELGLAEVGRSLARAAPTLAGVSLVPAAAVSGDDAGGGSARYLLSWELSAGDAAGDAGGAASRLDADLTVIPLDAERSELGVKGTWRAVAPAGTSPPGRVEGDARRIVRSFLRRLARACEDSSGGAAADQEREPARGSPGKARRGARAT